MNTYWISKKRHKQIPLCDLQLPEEALEAIRLLCEERGIPIDHPLVKRRIRAFKARLRREL